MADALDDPLAGSIDALHEACVRAGADFPGAVVWLRPLLTADADDAVMEFVAARLTDPGAIACLVYLLAHAHSADLAASAGWQALNLGCDDDWVIIALADVLAMQAQPRQAAAALMQERASAARSSEFLIKLADHYRTGGRAFLAEDALRGLIRSGRHDLVVRLAELWVEWDDWASARSLLATLPPEHETAYGSFLVGRCAASLLLEDEVIQRMEALMVLPEPGPRYASLLRCVWMWRVGDPAVAARCCPDGDFPPLLARDAEALRRATGVVAGPGSAGVWRDVGSRHDLPNVLGIGMQRTATSWLWRRLRGHPEVQWRTFKEPMFFNGYFAAPYPPDSDLREPELGPAGDLYWQGPTRSLLHYRGVFTGARRFRIDISPSYGELPEESVARVREILGPDVKVILSVRDPVERSWSNFKYNLGYTGEHPLAFSFAERIAAYRNVATMRRCDYASVLAIWRRYFQEIKIVFMEDVIARPDETLADVGRFIGLSAWAEGVAAAPINSSDAIDMPAEDRLFLFGLHQATYDAAEVALGGPALGWRQRQLDLIGAAAG